jgi:CheY-like chemotaxis protein
VPDGMDVDTLTTMTLQTKVLLVDDDLDDHEIFSLALREAEKPLEVIRAYDGMEALSYLADWHDDPPDFIFLDLNMPRMNGKQCLREIRKNEHFSHIPVVIYSISSEIKDLIDAQSLGAKAFIVKSASIHELTMALRDFFSDYPRVVHS